MLVCKRWSNLCLENPPQLAEATFQLQNTTAPSYLTWLAQSSRRAEKLRITSLNDQHPGKSYPLLPQQSLNSLLVRLSTCSPLLRTLAISGPHEEEFTFQGDCGYLEQGYVWDHWAGSLHLLSQLEHLILDVEFGPVDPDLADYGDVRVPQDFFTGMNLKVTASTAEICTHGQCSLGSKKLRHCKFPNHCTVNYGAFPTWKVLTWV